MKKKSSGPAPLGAEIRDQRLALQEKCRSEADSSSSSDDEPGPLRAALQSKAHASFLRRR